MADVALEGMDEIIRALDAAGALTDDTVSDILEAGAEVAVNEIRDGIRRSRYKIADYANHVSKSRVKKRKDGGAYITVTIDGKNEKGQRRAMIAFILNYGRRAGTGSRGGEIQGDYFWTKATQKAQKKAAAAMEAVLRDKLKQEGL